MKTIIVIILILFTGCIDKKERIRTAEHSRADTHITIIDGCEYITFFTYGGAANFTHKGNCKNCKK
jgi:hypothetical protein